jgi:hypothetical protein
MRIEVDIVEGENLTLGLLLSTADRRIPSAAGREHHSIGTVWVYTVRGGVPPHMHPSEILQTQSNTSEVAHQGTI